MENLTEIKKCCTFEFGIEDDAIMILGAANAGLVGTISASHIIEELDLKEVAHLHSSKFPPISVFIDGVLQNPFRIYADGAEGKNAKVFLATTELPLNKDTFHDVAHILLDYVAELGIQTVITLVGFPVQVLDKYDVFFAAEPEIFNKLKEIEGLKPLPKGMIYGLEALVLNETLERELDGYSLIVPVKEYMPATRSAAALIDILNKIYDFLDIDTEELIKRDDFLQNKLKELAEQIRRSQEPDQYMAPPPSKNMDSLFT